MYPRSTIRRTLTNIKKNVLAGPALIKVHVKDGKIQQTCILLAVLAIMQNIDTLSTEFARRHLDLMHYGNIEFVMCDVFMYLLKLEYNKWERDQPAHPNEDFVEEKYQVVQDWVYKCAITRAGLLAELQLEQRMDAAKIQTAYSNWFEMVRALTGLSGNLDAPMTPAF